MKYEMPVEVRGRLLAGVDRQVEHDLFELGGELCIPGHSAVQQAFIDRLETDLAGFNEDLPMLKEFILPGGGPAAAACPAPAASPPVRARA